MSYNMYVYDMGIVDYYNGMMPLIDYIKLCPEKGQICETKYLNHRELKSFLINCFMEVKTSDASWDGDISGLDEIAISGIPRPTGMTPYKMIVFKQKNNGHSFLVSELKIIISDESKADGMQMVFVQKEVEKRQLIGIFYESFDLVEALFAKALTLKEISQEENIHVIAKECLNRIEKSKTDQISEHTIIHPIPNIEKFDLNNYEKI